MIIAASLPYIYESLMHGVGSLCSVILYKYIVLLSNGNQLLVLFGHLCKIGLNSISISNLPH